MKLKDLTYGAILKNLLIIALPLTLTNLVNMAYNLTDMYWIGKVGYQAVTAIGTAGMFMWLAYGFFTLASSGTQIKVSHAVGEKDYEKLREYAITGLKIALFVGLAYGVVIFLFRSYAIDLYEIPTQLTADWAKTYLGIVAFAVVFLAINNAYVGILNGLGNSTTVLLISTSGLAVNMILDPIFIHVLDMGVAGAALATLIASMVPTILFTRFALKHTNIFEDFKLFRIHKDHVRVITKLSIPTSVQSLMFTLIAMSISKIVIDFGEEAMAVQRLGSQIESLTWMIGMGANIAISVYVGQNFAAGKWRRLIKGYVLMFGIMSVYGAIITVFLYLAGGQLFDVFLDETYVIEMGATYLKILSLSQLGMMIETICAGAFYGLGKTKIPSIISIVGNVLRLPLAMYLSNQFGVEGIWWAITISSILKGLLNLIMFVIESVINENIKFKYFIEKYDVSIEG